MDNPAEIVRALIREMGQQIKSIEAEATMPKNLARSDRLDQDSLRVPIHRSGRSLPSGQHCDSKQFQARPIDRSCTR